MPELPEVETLRRDLERHGLGKVITGVAVGNRRSIRRHAGAEELIRAVEGRRLVGVGRKGKYLLLRLEDASVLVVHLGMSGQLLLVPGDEPIEKHCHVVFTLGGGEQLRFVDPRTFGEVFVSVPDGHDREVPELSHLGLDPLAEVRSWAELGARLSARSPRGIRRLKSLLMDQRVLAGIGNIYSDEILFGSGLRHDRSPMTLTPAELRRLYRATVDTLEEAIEFRGSSLADQQYRDLHGQVGEHRSRHRVYGREGKPCVRCGTSIVREKVGGRSTFWCPRCQR